MNSKKDEVVSMVWVKSYKTGTPVQIPEDQYTHFAKDLELCSAPVDVEEEVEAPVVEVLPEAEEFTIDEDSGEMIPVVKEEVKPVVKKRNPRKKKITKVS